MCSPESASVEVIALTFFKESNLIIFDCAGSLLLSKDLVAWDVGSSLIRDQTCVPSIAQESCVPRFLTTEPWGKPRFYFKYIFFLVNKQWLSNIQQVSLLKAFSEPFICQYALWKYWRQRRGWQEDEIVGWHHQFSGHELWWILGDDEGQGSLACCSPWGHKESDMI